MRTTKTPAPPLSASKYGDVLLKIQYHGEEYADWFDRYTGFQDVAMMAQAHFNTGPGYFLMKDLRDGAMYGLGRALLECDLHDGDAFRLVRVRECETCGTILEVADI